MSEFTNRLLLHHEFWKNPPEFGGVKDVDRESLTADLEEAADQIESLQRENEDLRRIASEKHDEVLALEAAAITPEMRERMKIALYEEFAEPEDHSEYSRRIFRDLLGEQG